MTAMNGTGPAAFLGRHEGLRGRLPGASLPWVEALRDRSAAAFRAQGFPTRRVEAWKYTDLAAVNTSVFGEPLTGVDDALALPPATGPRAVFIDGRFRADLSNLEGLSYTVENLAWALPTLETRLGALVRPEEQALAALNGMLFEDGLVVTVPDGVAAGVLHLVSFATESERAPAFHPRHLVRLGEGASLTLIETAAGPVRARYLHNPVFEIEVAAGARMNHGRLQQEGREAFFLSTVYARVQEGGTYDNFTMNAGSRLARNEIHVALCGPKAECHMNGVQLLADGQHADTTTALDHAAPDCSSRQTYKTVLSGKSRGVFQGKILVRQIAQKTDGYQMNQALLLSPEAEIDSKPQLEIYADDVKCSHGATVGELDAEQIFFLRSRGIPAEQAKAILVEAFLTEAVEAVADEHIREALTGAVAGWWQRQGIQGGIEAA
ncbi:Fe-S cluster assembly protein SufD [Falsiroseomonas tokyonensis]|uniref:Fe-S cluster assembly protein SufD n=1 Tax=Falsiroseomonas tokyonensis TaxID=430521 RepID=A0ABV7BZV7_9PROT|nr:Fe-S cluster assembly protein SufD [Falsiroseomonas tokyonensis]MBU8541189.1 Fe-S cluster assembly protein SufD [Falsiroseomonas tokyonensis]